VYFPCDAMVAFNGVEGVKGFYEALLMNLGNG
jgi:hypothetical protein